MATTARRPLANRHLPLQIPDAFSPKFVKSNILPAKRPRSPDHNESRTPNALLKRARHTALSPEATIGRDVDKDRKHAVREQQRIEFKEKYSRAFPGWRFYFDVEDIGLDPGSLSVMEEKIQSLEGHIDDFFSRQVTHLITNKPVPQKENHLKAKSISNRTLHRSPSKLRNCVNDDAGSPGFDIVSKAISFQIKIWNTTKLESVLSRCLDSPEYGTTRVCASQGTIRSSQRSLSRLLQSEKIHGTTERDPTQKRYDFRYFSRFSRFVLIEDLYKQLATVAAHEYPMVKGKEEQYKFPWPTLYCHPRSRGPFIPFDERERRRWEKNQKMDPQQEEEQEIPKQKIQNEVVWKAELHVKKTGDLRRSVSMSNMRRRASHPNPSRLPIDLDVDGGYPDLATVSGYLASGVGGAYMAASGNSVGVTSTTGTTSAGGYAPRKIHIPSSLSGRPEVVTSRKFPSTAAKNWCKENISAMPPPLAVPERNRLLRKSKSTNTLKLPKREEGTKPGYCESCRIKFEDFKMHIKGNRHRRFAREPSNFSQLDCVLGQVQRLTLLEVKEQYRNREESRALYCSTTHKQCITTRDHCSVSSVDTLLTDAT